MSSANDHNLPNLNIGEPKVDHQMDTIKGYVTTPMPLANNTY